MGSSGQISARREPACRAVSNAFGAGLNLVAIPIIGTASLNGSGTLTIAARGGGVSGDSLPLRPCRSRAARAMLGRMTRREGDGHAGARRGTGRAGGTVPGFAGDVPLRHESVGTRGDR